DPGVCLTPAVRHEVVELTCRKGLRYDKARLDVETDPVEVALLVRRPVLGVLGRVVLAAAAGRRGVLAAERVAELVRNGRVRAVEVDDHRRLVAAAGGAARLHPEV